jgi:putative two-component system response regulator
MMIGKTHAEARIVLIDHEPTTLDELSGALASAGYLPPEGIVNPSAVLTYLEQTQPDLVVLELPMPGVDGYALLGSLTDQVHQDVPFPVLALGMPQDPEMRRRAVEAGAKDFLAKPVDTQDFLLHVYSLLDTRFVQVRLRETRNLLEELVRLRTAELKRGQLETLELLGRVAEVRDDATGRHTKRVGRLSGLIAGELHLPPDQVELIMRAAPLHDLGKVAISDSVLLKTGTFEGDERESMRQHATVGAQLLEGARSDLLATARVIAVAHHERWDGQGYPSGLSGSAIPLAARIVAVADAFDALTHTRPYKPAWPLCDALAEIEREREWQFDPQVVDALLRLSKRGSLFSSGQLLSPVQERV